LILGKKGPLEPAHKLAIKYINKGKPITAVEVNKVLAFSDIKITQKMLDKILSMPRLDFSNLDSNTIRSDRFLQSIGTVRGKVQVPGIYIWTHLSTGDMYVGSSSTLARRLIGYFKNTHKNTGKLIPLIKREGVSAFKLQVIPLIEGYSVNQELSLEQYFLLHSKFNLNILKVVNDFSGARSKPLYMYTKDFSELIYSSHIQEDFIFKLQIHHSIFSNSLKTGAVYLDKYIFTDKPIIGVRERNMSEKEINIMLEKERLEVKSTQKIGRKVLIKAMDGKHYTKLFNSISDCIAYLNNIAPSNKTTLYRHIKSERPYHGYLCQ
jgi:group I intron endonuclease